MDLTAPIRLTRRWPDTCLTRSMCRCPPPRREAARPSAMPTMRHAEPLRANPYFEPVQPIEEWPDMAFAAPVPGHQVTPPSTRRASPAAFDRMQLSTWAMLRGTPGPASPRRNGNAGRKPGRGAAAVAVQPAPRRQPSHHRSGQQPAWRRGGARHPLPAVRVDPGRHHRRAAQGVWPIWRRPQCLRRLCRGRAVRAAAAAQLQPRRLPPGRDRRREKPRLVRRRAGRGDPPGLQEFLRRARGVGRGAAGPVAPRRRPAPVASRRQAHAGPCRLSPQAVGNAQPGSGGVVTIAGDF